MPKTRISSVLLVVLLIISCGPKNETSLAPDKAATTDAEGSAGSCSLVMGWDPWEPYMYEDVDGSVRGLDIELISAFAGKAGCETSFVKASWTELLSRLRSGKVDVVAGASETEARKSFAWFSNPYRREAFALYVRDTESSKYPSTLMPAILDMGMRVGVVSDYVYGHEISNLQESQKYAGQFIQVPIGELNYLSLLDYKIDGFLEDPFVAATVLRKKGLDEDIEKHPLVIDSGGVHFMFSKASVGEDVVKRMNKGMSEMIADGSYQAILDKYSH